MSTLPNEDECCKNKHMKEPAVKYDDILHPGRVPDQETAGADRARRALIGKLIIKIDFKIIIKKKTLAFTVKCPLFTMNFLY